MPEAIVEREGHTLIVTMNRPEARNALSGEMMQIMSDAWDEVNANPDIRVAILTGAGGHFCAGADLKGFAASAPGDGMAEGQRQGTFDPTVLKPLLKGFLLDKPLIAAVEGYAVAGGTEILQGTDSLSDTGASALPMRFWLVKTLNEYARHNGHADLLRERIDGQTGE